MAERYFSNLSLASPEDDAKRVSHNGVPAWRGAIPTFPDPVDSVHDDLHQCIKALFALFLEFSTSHTGEKSLLTSLARFNHPLLKTCTCQDQGD